MLKYYEIYFHQPFNGAINYRALPVRGAGYGKNKYEAIQQLRVFMQSLGLDIGIYVMETRLSDEREYYKFVKEAKFWAKQIRPLVDKQ